MNKINK